MLEPVRHIDVKPGPDPISPAERRLPRSLRLRLKFELLAHGLDLPTDVVELFERQRWKLPLRTRSGASGGLDLRIDHDLYVNSPVNYPGAPREARWRLVLQEDSLLLRDQTEEIPASGLPRPAYYDATLEDGTPAVRIGQQCSADRICIGIVRGCYFWRRDRRCTFCSIGANASREAPRKDPANVAEAVALAASDPRLPAKHVLLGGGTPNEPDFGAARTSELCRAIKKTTQLSVYAMLVPSSNPDDVKRLRDAGVDELGFNMEFYSEEAARRFMPGKLECVGMEGYRRSLRTVAKIFGPVGARSLLIVGLEPAADSLKGVQLLSALGVMPILSPFRSLAGTALSSHPGWEAGQFIELYERARDSDMQWGQPLGPTCISCQSNTLALPEDHPLYVAY